VLSAWKEGAVVRRLADGAVELPAAHLSARVAWHDTDWTGRVRSAPGANHSCAALSRIKEDKNADTEEEDAGTPWGDLDRSRVCEASHHGPAG
jgi:hypothetical protein